MRGKPFALLCSTPEHCGKVTHVSMSPPLGTTGERIRGGTPWLSTFETIKKKLVISLPLFLQYGVKKHDFCLVCKGVFLWDFELVIAISSENCSISKGCPLYFIDGNMDIFGEPMIFNIISQLTNLRVKVQVYCSLSAQVLMLLRTWAMCPHIVISHLMAFFLHVSYSKWNSSCLFFCQYTAWVAFSWQKKGKKKIEPWLK